MPPYYTLVDPARELDDLLPGRDDEGDPLLVTHTPRQLMPSWHPNVLICDTTPGQLLSQPELAFRIAQVTHESTVVTTARGDVADVVVAEAEQWRVAEFAALDPFFGPQAGPLRAMLHAAETVLHNSPDAPQSRRYFDALAQQHAGGWWLLHEQAAAAREALEIAGADGHWWASGAGFGTGAELLALAARDLIGTTTSWTGAAYDALVQPWRHVFGPLHPDDGEC